MYQYIYLCIYVCVNKYDYEDANLKHGILLSDFVFVVYEDATASVLLWLPK
jgi:hypothetical protein